MMSSTRSRAIIILLFESLLTCLCGVAAIWICAGSQVIEILNSFHIWLKVGLLMLVVQGAFYVFDLYDFRRIRQRASLYLRIFQGMGLTAIALAVIFYILPQMMLGRGVFLVSLLLMLTLMSCWRVFVNWLLVEYPRPDERVLTIEQNGVSIRKGKRRIEHRVTDAPGTKILSVVDFLVSPKTVEQTFKPLIADWRCEYFEALKQGRTKKARWISIRYRFAFVCTFFKAMGLSKVFSLFKQVNK